MADAVLPFAGMRVLDFAQFVAGPVAALRLSDLGAEVIKVERPQGGDLCRSMVVYDQRLDGDSLVFHTFACGKKNVAADLKAPTDLDKVRALIATMDVMTHTFRPGVMERIGLGYDAVRALKPDIVYGSISGFGPVGEWADLPGQDLLARPRSGVMWLSGNADRHRVGGLVETSLLKGLINLQFEFITTWLNSGAVAPERDREGSAHGYLPAPYGVFETAEGHLALAMTRLETLASVPGLDSIARFAAEKDAGFRHRHEIHAALRQVLKRDDARSWGRQPTERGIWCARVLDWAGGLESESGRRLKMAPSAGASEPFAPNLVA